MAREPMTLEEIRATRPMADAAKIATTTEEDIRRHQIEDGEDPDGPLPPFRLMSNVRVIRTQLQMTQETFAKAIGRHVATVRNWKQSRSNMDLAVRSLPRVVEREPDAALRALAGDQAAGLKPQRTNPYYGAFLGSWWTWARSGAGQAVARLLRLFDRGAALRTLRLG